MTSRSSPGSNATWSFGSRSNRRATGLIVDLSELPLKHVVLVMATREGVNDQTRKCVDRVEELGASRLQLAGCSDVATARNLLLTHALDTCEEHKTVFLLVDDDILFDPGVAQLVCEDALEGEQPVSAVYATNNGAIAGTPRGDGLWNTGLGFLAVRRDKLAEYAETLGGKLPGMNKNLIYPFCQSRVSRDGKEWHAEDYWFCDGMGGVVLKPLGVGHLKRVPLTPDQHTLDMIADPKATEARQKAEQAAE